jgi:DNA-binding MarR family transcriptional regulator
MSAPSRTTSRPSDADYERLLGVRDGLRRFLHWSEAQARDAGLTPAQHQLLLAVRGHGEPPSVGDVAAHLLLRHHSAVELVDRAERAGLIRRSTDPDDNRIVRLALTKAGEERLADLATSHLEQLGRLRPDVERLWAGL